MATQPPSPKRAEPPIFGPRLLWPNGCMDQDATRYDGMPRPTRHCVRWGPAPPPLKEHSLQFSANVRCGQTAGWTKMPLGMEVGLGPGDFAFDGDPATPRKKGTPTLAHFLAHVYCGQTAGQIKIPLGTEVNVGSDVVLDGVAAPLKWAQPLVFGSCLVWPNGWMDEDATWYGSRPWPRPHCIRRGPSSPRKGHSVPLFWAHVYCGHGRPSQSATAE